MKEAIPILKNLLEWFKLQRLFKFYGSSLLFLYDGAAGVAAPLVIKVSTSSSLCVFIPMI